MISEHRQLIDKVFTRALELTDGARHAYVAEACPDDATRHEVLALLAAATSEKLDERFDTVRERLWSDIVAADPTPEDDLTGQRIDAWRIGDRLARGGLATVYLASRAGGEFEQTAAFKVLRRGLDTDDVIARFRAERQILSSLDHPAIAQIMDGGALPDGRPYLVLEYVDGIPIGEYCKQNNTSVRDRVSLIIQVLRALHHAHRHTVVHRDIKPSNILVSTEGNVSLLDFGIAKLLDPTALPGSSTQTRTGVSLLTPGYGSPEQHAGQAVTTASDIYQAGMVLYELLTLQRPRFAGPNGQAADAGPPSKLLRGTSIYKRVLGDLDAITQKAMQADPARRYGSANEMVADLERYLDGRPVMAQPDTIAYRVSKLTKRRPWLIPVAVVVLLGLAAYVTTLTIYSRQLQLEQQRAQAAQDFMVELFSSADPFASNDPETGRRITVVEALDLGRRRLETELRDQAELRAALLGSIAGVYQSLDQNDAAIELGQKALDLNAALYGEESTAVLENLRLLASAHDDIGEYEQARPYFERQLSIARTRFANDDLQVASAEIASGIFETGQGRHELALQLLESGIDRLRSSPEENARLFITAVISVIDQAGTNDPQAYVELLDEGLTVAESVYGEESLYTANVRLAIARNGFYLGELAAAKANYDIGLRMFDRLLGPLHRDTIGHLNNYGFLLMGMKDDAGAEAVHRELIDRLSQLPGEFDKLLADNYQNLGSAIGRQGRLDDALPLHLKARELYRSVFDEHYYVGVFPLLSIAYIHLRQGNGAAAESAAAEALETFRVSVPDTYLEGVAQCLVGLGKEQRGDLIDGAAMVEASHELMLPIPVNLAASPYPKLCRVPDSGTP